MRVNAGIAVWPSQISSISFLFILRWLMEWCPVVQHLLGPEVYLDSRLGNSGELLPVGPNLPAWSVWHYAGNDKREQVRTK